MGLDNFCTGQNNNDATDDSNGNSGDSGSTGTDSPSSRLNSNEDAVQETVSSDGDNNDKQETTTTNSTSGLDSFKTDTTPTGNGGQNESDGKDEYTFGIPPAQRNQMSKSERVRYIRDNHIEDYHPDYKPDGGWEYVEVAQVRCVCGNTLIVQNVGVCSKCSRAYKRTNRAVIKQTRDNNNNEHKK